jgi:hypothetical protein
VHMQDQAQGIRRLRDKEHRNQTKAKRSRKEESEEAVAVAVCMIGRGTRWIFSVVLSNYGWRHGMLVNPPEQLTPNQEAHPHAPLLQRRSGGEGVCIDHLWTICLKNFTHGFFPCFHARQ